MALPNASVERRGGGLGRRNPSQDMISGLLAMAPAAGLAATDAQLNTTYELISVEDAEALGITATYDTDNGVPLHYHIEEFFRMSPDGTLFLRLSDPTNDALDVLDKDEAHAQQIIKDASGKVRQLGVAFSSSAFYGLSADLTTLVAKAQELVEHNRGNHRPFHCLLEGKNFTDTAVAALDLRAQTAEGVSVVVAQDPYMVSLDAAFAPCAAIGTLLGTVSAARVNQSVAMVSRFNLTDVAGGRFLSAQLSDGRKFEELSDAHQAALNDKGYILTRILTDFDGVYFNDSHTCVERASDFFSIENNRVMDKAARLIRKANLPRLSAPVEIGSDGKLDPIVCKGFEGDALEGLSVMRQTPVEASRVEAYCNPEQNVLATDEIVVEYAITPTGTARSIKGIVRFKNPANNG